MFFVQIIHWAFIGGSFIFENDQKNRSIFGSELGDGRLLEHGRLLEFLR